MRLVGPQYALSRGWWLRPSGKPDTNPIKYRPADRMGRAVAGELDQGEQWERCQSGCGSSAARPRGPPLVLRAQRAGACPSAITPLRWRSQRPWRGSPFASRLRGCRGGWVGFCSLRHLRRPAPPGPRPAGSHLRCAKSPRERRISEHSAAHRPEAVNRDRFPCAAVEAVHWQGTGASSSGGWALNLKGTGAPARDVDCCPHRPTNQGARERCPFSTCRWMSTSCC
jgi:hypothetical protein